MPEYTIYVGADHRGFEKKNELIELLKGCHPGMVKVEDLGPDHYDENDDYNDMAVAVAKAVLDTENSFGVLTCGSAHGVTMQANRFKGIRAVNADSVESAKHARTNDYANVICLSADYLDLEMMENLVKTFCHTQPIKSENYERRAQKLDLDYNTEKDRV